MYWVNILYAQGNDISCPYTLTTCQQFLPFFENSPISYPQSYRKHKLGTVGTCLLN